MSKNEKNAENKGVHSISLRKLEANRENSKKSTGPKTSQGKAIVRLHAQKHGLTAKLLMRGADGKPLNPGLEELDDYLHDRYGRGDAYTEQLIQNILFGCWRRDRCSEAEMAHFSRPGNVSQPDAAFFPGGSLTLIDRYQISTERAFAKNYQLLEKLHPEPPQVPVDPDDSSEDDLLAFNGGETEVGPDEQLSTATLAAPNSPTTAAEIDEAPKPVVTPQVAASREVASGREQLERPVPGVTTLLPPAPRCLPKPRCGWRMSK